MKENEWWLIALSAQGAVAFILSGILTDVGVYSATSASLTVVGGMSLFLAVFCFLFIEGKRPPK